MNVGDLAKCADCDLAGVVVCTDVMGTDFDQSLHAKTITPLEPSAYEPGGVTCRACEGQRFKDKLPTRGVCAWCGKPNVRALKEDLGVSRSFCDDRCRSDHLNAELKPKVDLAELLGPSEEPEE